MIPRQVLQHSSYNNVLIDVFACAHFFYHSALKKGSSKKDLDFMSLNGMNASSKPIYALLVHSMIEFFNSFEDTNQNVYLLFDNPLSKVEARARISSTYKENRKSKMSQTFYNTIDFVQFYCIQAYGGKYKICRTPLREADDLAKVLVEDLINKKETVVLIANDSDWYACLHSQPDVHQWWFTYGSENKDIYTPSHFLTEYGFEPSENKVTLYKALMGDKADCIEGICRARDLSLDNLLYIIKEYSNNSYNLPAIINLDKSLPPNVISLISENRNQLRINLKLVDRIETSLTMIDKYMWEGKNNKVLKNALKKIIMAALSNNHIIKEYSFGGVALNV